MSLPSNQMVVQAKVVPGLQRQVDTKQGVLSLSLFTPEGYPLDLIASFDAAGQLINTLQTDVADLTDQVTTLEGQVADLLTRVTALEGA